MILSTRYRSIVLGVAVLALAAGCQPSRPPALVDGYAALKASQFDRALTLADQQIAKTPSGPSAAEAFYLRGRALEQRPASTASESASRWAQARTAYQQCLAQSPPPQLRAYALASLGNVAFFQDDYATAAESFRQAYSNLDSSDSRAWALYRAGLSYQRLGRFADADRFFDEVVRRYPNTLQARRASENRGQRAFFIRLASFSSESRANQAAADLRRQGFSGISIVRDSRGTFLVRVGPYSSYNAAQSGRLQALSRFPDALIMP
jgi:tetratricopeptide (TPR) repeat protein